MNQGKKIIVHNDRCAGCLLCVLTCSFVNTGVFNPKKSFIKVNKDDKAQKFRLTIGAKCRLCGSCILACAYNAIRWDDEDTKC